MKKLLFSVFCLLSGCLWAQNMRPVSLSESLQMALENSTQLRKSKIDREALEVKIRESRSAMYPQISAVLGMDYFGELPKQIFPGQPFGLADGTFIALETGRPWQMSGVITMQQPILNESLRRKIPAMNTTRALADLLAQKSEEEVVFQTASVFYQTLQTEQLLRSINANLGKLEALERIAQLQLANGYAIPTDVKRIKVARTNLETQRQNLYTGISALRQTLQFLCGVPFEEPFEPVEEMSNPTADSLLWQNLLLEPETTVEHRLLLRNVELQRIQRRSLAAENLPSLNAYATASTQTFRSNPLFVDPDSRWYGVAAIGLRLQVPVFDGFRLQRKSALLKLEGLKLEEDRRQLTQAKTLEFRLAREQANNAFHALRTQNDNVALAREISDKFLLQYKEGVVSLTDLLTAQTALSEAETNYWQQVFTYKLAVLKVLKAAGRLQELTIKSE